MSSSITQFTTEAPGTMATHVEYVGAFAKVNWSSDAGDYIIGRLEDGTTVKGPAESDELKPGIVYKFFGRWQQSNNPRFPAPSFMFTAFVKDVPHGRHAVVQYIVRSLKGQNTGIGEVTAHKLYDIYEADAVRKLRMSPTEVAEAIKHDVDKCRHASSILEHDKRFEDCKISLVEMFAGKGFGKKTIADCIERWKARAAAFVKRDPFLLLTNRISGAGFSRTDNLYLSLGGNPAKMKRQVLAASDGIRKNGAGNTWHPVSIATDTIRAKVDGVNIDPIKAIKIGGRTKRFAFHLDAGYVTWIADHEYAKSESDIARLIGARLKLPAAWPSISDATVTPHQREQLAVATSRRIGILCGTPGTGKTYVTAALVRAVIESAIGGHGGTVIAAPTGKAAVRITEMLSKYEMGIRASTIHRLLKPNGAGYGTNDWTFSHDESQPMAADFVFVDEVSMCDTCLMAGLLRACKPTAHILLIGDPYQLPPVGHGAPLRDLITAGVPCGELTELKRNSGLIVDACRKIKSGQPFATVKAFATDADETGHNLMLSYVSSAAGAVGEIKRIYQGILAGGRRDPFEDAQVIVAMNDKGEASRSKLNGYLQALLNPDGATVDGCKFRVHDKVICLSNDFYMDWVNSKQRHYVCNGEMGRIIHVEKEFAVAEFCDTGDGWTRQVKIFHGKKPKSKGGGGSDDNSQAADESSGFFDLAYAITCHKSQGSEWPIVIVVSDDAADRVASREWHYTAISRARSRCILVGSLATIGKQCKRITLKDRKTFLVEKLKPLLDEIGIEKPTSTPLDQPPLDQPSGDDEHAATDAEFSEFDLPRTTDSIASIDPNEEFAMCGSSTVDDDCPF